MLSNLLSGPERKSQIEEDIGYKVPKIPAPGFRNSRAFAESYEDKESADTYNAFQGSSAYVDPELFLSKLSGSKGPAKQASALFNPDISDLKSSNLTRERDTLGCSE